MSKSILIDVSHASKKGSSIRITLPKKVLEILGASQYAIIGFFAEDGRIFLKKLD